MTVDFKGRGALHQGGLADHGVAQKYGRVVMTTSTSGLYGNFGQSDYGAAKLALVGLMQSLALEGARHDIRVNCLAPTAATRKTEGLMPQQVLRALEPQAVSPPMLVLASDSAPNRAVLCARETAGAPARLTGGPAARWSGRAHAIYSKVRRSAAIGASGLGRLD